jgi:WD40 repeat protein
VLKIVFSPDSKTIASAALDGTVRLWNVDTGQETANLATHSGSVVSIQFSSDSRALAAIVDSHSPSPQDPSMQTVRIFVWSGRRDKSRDAHASTH